MMIHGVLLSALALPVAAAVVAPDQPVNGISQDELSIRWWQWMTSYPSAGNPVTDTTGASAGLGSDQGPVAHPGVFFLAGNFSGNETRSVTIGSDQAIFLPFVNTVSLIPLFGADEAAVRADAAATLGTVDGLSAKLNGVDVTLPAAAPDLSGYRQMSALFPLTIGAGTIYADLGVPPGTYDSVADGYWLALEPLAPGQYSLTFTSHASGTPNVYPEFSLTQTYEITVQAPVPEPGTWAFMIGGLVVLGATMRRMRGLRESPTV
jgi:hypothetical protein